MQCTIMVWKNHMNNYSGDLTFQTQLPELLRISPTEIGIVWLKCRIAAFGSSEHDIFSFINFRCEVMATTCIWMVCYHHSSMSFFDLLCWSTFSDSKYQSRFPPRHRRLKTTFVKFPHSSCRRSCLECLPGPDAILTSISSSSDCHSRYQWCNLIRLLHSNSQ